MKFCYQQLELIESAESFVLKGKDQDGEPVQVQIDRSNNVLKKISSTEADAIKKTSSQRISAVLGSIELLSGRYLIVVKESTPAAKIDTIHTIHSIVEAKIIPYYLKPVPTQHQSDESRYLELLSTILHDGTFYFSYSYDATITTQNWFKQSKTLSYVGENVSITRLCIIPTLAIGSILSEMINMRIIHHSLMNTFCGMVSWRRILLLKVMPVLAGLFQPLEDVSRSVIDINLNIIVVETKEAKVDDITFNLTILSRMGCKRVGTRYNMRGADPVGNVANFVETEQIVEYNNHFISFLQVRGSIPLSWSQKANIQYKPPVTLRKEGKTFEKHFDNILDRYSKIVVVNLVNQKGSEKRLADEYENQYKSYKENHNIKYIAFDFHNKCKSMNYNAIAELTDQVEGPMREFGFFHMNATDGKILSEQKGVIRSNCIDCLDRTNVCQSVFSKIMLTNQLQLLNIIPKTNKVADYKGLNYTYQNGM